MSFVGQAAAFEREPENVHDCFAVAIKHLLLLLCSFLLVLFYYLFFLQKLSFVSQFMTTTKSTNNPVVRTGHWQDSPVHPP